MALQQMGHGHGMEMRSVGSNFPRTTYLRPIGSGTMRDNSPNRADQPSTSRQSNRQQMRRREGKRLKSPPKISHVPRGGK